MHSEKFNRHLYFHVLIQYINIKWNISEKLLHKALGAS